MEAVTCSGGCVCDCSAKICAFGPQMLRMCADGAHAEARSRRHERRRAGRREFGAVAAIESGSRNQIAVASSGASFSVVVRFVSRAFILKRMSPSRRFVRRKNETQSYEFMTTNNTNTIQLHRVLRATPDRVYRAFLD